MWIPIGIMWKAQVVIYGLTFFLIVVTSVKNPDKPSEYWEQNRLKSFLKVWAFLSCLNKWFFDIFCIHYWRMKRKQKMQWTRENAHNVLQIKTTMSSNEWDKYQMNIDKNLINKKVAWVNIWTFEIKIFKIWWNLGRLWPKICKKKILNFKILKNFFLYRVNILGKNWLLGFISILIFRLLKKFYFIWNRVEIFYLIKWDVFM